MVAPTLSEVALRSDFLIQFVLIGRLIFLTQLSGLLLSVGGRFKLLLNVCYPARIQISPSSSIATAAWAATLICSNLTMSGS